MKKTQSAEDKVGTKQKNELLNARSKVCENCPATFSDLTAHNIHLCLETGEEIMYLTGRPIPRIGDILKIEFPNGAYPELLLLVKIFKRPLIQKHHTPHKFRFKVKSLVECSIYEEGFFCAYTFIVEPMINPKAFKRIKLNRVNQNNS